MELEVRSASEWGKRRYRYTCAACGAHGSREATAQRAFAFAMRKTDPGRKYTRQPITCEYYKRHSFKEHVIKCESVFAEGMLTSNSFADKKTMLIHVQQYCRGNPDACPVRQMCQAKYKK